MSGPNVRDRVKSTLRSSGLLPVAKRARYLALSGRERVRRLTHRRPAATPSSAEGTLAIGTAVLPDNGARRPRSVVTVVRTSPIARDAMEANRDLVVSALTSRGIAHLDLPITSRTRTRVAIRSHDIEAAVDALVEVAGSSLYIWFDSASPDVPPAAVHVGSTSRRELLRLAQRYLVWVAYRHHADPHGTDVFDEAYGCEIEVWRRAPGTTDLTGVRSNLVAQSLPADLFATDAVPAVLRRETWPAFNHLPRFPIDVVYTWVDGDDPTWRTRRDAAMGVTAEQRHPEAANDARFASRDELRYSLRSLEKYADFVNHVYLVTDDQCPAWLRRDHPRLTVVDHRDIFPEDAALPTFNSHSIESRLHHVPGLSEHYIYMNDDFLFGRRVDASNFFLASGLARFFYSPANIPIGDPGIEVKPVDAAAMNGRDLVAAEFGARPTFKFKHAPYAQRRSIHLQIEQLFPDDVARTTNSRFRHPSDLPLASSMHHHVGFALGLAVPGNITSAYADLGEPDLEEQLDVIRTQRRAEVFCLNDTDSAAMPPERKNRIVGEFLEGYYPEPSSFEIS
jgi:hypothetical protein